MREKQIQDFRQTLIDHKIVQLVGDNGIGKDHLVTSYQNQFSNIYRHIIHIYDLVCHSYEFLSPNNIFGFSTPFSGMKEIVNEIKEISLHFPVLLVFHNIGLVLSDLQLEYMPINLNDPGNCHVIFVEHLPSNLKYKAHRFELGPLSKEECKVIIKQGPYIGEEFIDEIILLSKGNPLLLKQICSYLQYNFTRSGETTIYMDNIRTSCKNTTDISLSNILLLKSKQIMNKDDLWFLALLGHLTDKPFRKEWIKQYIFGCNGVKYIDNLEEIGLCEVVDKYAVFNKNILSIFRNQWGSFDDDISRLVNIFTSLTSSKASAEIKSEIFPHVSHFYNHLSHLISNFYLSDTLLQMSYFEFLIARNIQPAMRIVIQHCMNQIPHLDQNTSDWLIAIICFQNGILGSYSETKDIQEIHRCFLRAKKIYIKDAKRFTKNQVDQVNVRLVTTFYELKDYKTSIELATPLLSSHLLALEENRLLYLGTIKTLLNSLYEIGDREAIKTSIQTIESKVKPLSEGKKIPLSLEIRFYIRLYVCQKIMGFNEKSKKTRQYLTTLISNKSDQQLSLGFQPEQLIKQELKELGLKNQVPSSHSKILIPSVLILSLAFVVFKFLKK